MWGGAKRAAERNGHFLSSNVVIYQSKHLLGAIGHSVCTPDPLGANPGSLGATPKRGIQGCLGYADDLLLLSASRTGIKGMVSIKEKFAKNKDLKFRTDEDPNKSSSPLGGASQAPWEHAAS